jgi:hypothetical protein
MTGIGHGREYSSRGLHFYFHALQHHVAESQDEFWGEVGLSVCHE